MRVAFGTVVYRQDMSVARELIESVNSQDYDDFEMLLLNDNVQDAGFLVADILLIKKLSKVGNPL